MAEPSNPNAQVAGPRLDFAYKIVTAPGEPAHYVVLGATQVEAPHGWVAEPLLIETHDDGLSWQTIDPPEGLSPLAFSFAPNDPDTRLLAAEGSSPGPAGGLFRRVGDGPWLGVDEARVAPTDRQRSKPL